LSCSLLTGCQLLGISPFEGQIDHERVWNARSNGDYSYLVDRYCFCIPSGRFRIDVVDYEIQSVVYAESGEAIDSGEWEYIHTIEQMFELIAEAEARRASKVDVEYSRRGYPKTIDIDWIEEAADDEIYYQVLEVTLRD
jgi:hypothetical protein